MNFAILRSGSQCMHAAALILDTHPRMLFSQLCIICFEPPISRSWVLGRQSLDFDGIWAYNSGDTYGRKLIQSPLDSSQFKASTHG